MKCIIAALCAISTLTAFSYEREPLLFELVNKRLVLEESIKEDNALCPRQLLVSIQDISKGLYKEFGNTAIFVDGTIFPKGRRGNGIGAIIPLSGINKDVQKKTYKDSDSKVYYSRQAKSERDSFSHTYKMYEAFTYTSWLNGAGSGPFTKILRHDRKLDVQRDGKNVVVDYSEYDNQYDERNEVLSCVYSIE